MAQIALNYSAAQINAAIAKITTLISVIEGNIVQLYDDTTAIYPRTKAEAVFFDNDTSKTLNKEFNQLEQQLIEATNRSITPDMLSESTKQYIEASGGGTITNLVDDEDLTTVGNVIKFANKDHNTAAYSGLARRYLRKNIVNGKNILTQEMINDSQTIYIIQYDYDLDGQGLDINHGCVLDFQGGSFKNGTIWCDCTYINGSVNCFTGITIRGDVVNDIHFSWVGVVGNYPYNSEHMRNLVNHDIKHYIVDSDVYLGGNDIKLPPNVTINGMGHTLYFESAEYDEACIILAQNDVLENINIISSCNDYFDGNILCASTPTNQVHSFDLINVKIGEQWNEKGDYNATGIRIKADNSSTETGNYITNCNLNNINISNVGFGVEIMCENYEKSNAETLPQHDRFAWLNEIHINNIYISAIYNGIFTKFTENATTNKANSVGPIYVNNYEFQALNGDALMFEHDGKWRLIINTGFSYDNTYKGVINNGGVVVTNNVLGCYQDDTNGEGADYKVTDSVKIYSGELIKDSNELATMASFRRNNYSHYSGMQYWNIGVEGQNFVIKEAEGYLSEKMFCRSNQEFSKAYTFNGLQYNQKYSRNLSAGLKYYIAAPDYGLNHDRQVVLSLSRTSSKINIHESYGMTEVYKGGLSKLIDEGNIAFIKIKLSFTINGSVVSYNDAVTYFGKSTINTSIAPRVSIYGFSIIENYYRIIGNDLCIYVIAKKIDSTSGMNYTFSVTYDRFFLKNNNSWHTETTGEVVIDALDDQYFISGFTLDIADYKTQGATNKRPNLTDAVFKGFQYFDTTLNKPIWWTGSAWVDATGANV